MLEKYMFNKPFSIKGILEFNPEDVLAKKAVSSQELIDVIQNLEESGISYSWAPAIDEEIKHNVACGQAMTAFKNKHTNLPIRKKGV